MKKYEITDIQHPDNPKLFRIRAVRDIPKYKVKAGDLGGYVENENNLSQEGDCWIGGDAHVYGNARVRDNAKVYGNAKIYGNAQVHNSGWVSGNAHVHGNTHVYNDAQVYGNADVFGNASVFGNTRVYEDSQVFDDAKVFGNAHVYGVAVVNENMQIQGVCDINLPNQIYYVDGITAYFDIHRNLLVNGTTPETEYHKTLARLKL